MDFRQIKSMLKVDFKRMFKSKFFYILLACALVIPVLITVMMTMMDGTVSVDPQTGAETIMKGPENAWQSIGSFPSSDGSAMGGMDVMSMCNINMTFMLAAVFVCLFISDDFRSGYAKNIFTVRAKKASYVFSKTAAGFLCGALMILLYFFGAMLGGAVSGLSFDLGSLSALNITACIISKIFLMPVFVSVFVLVSVSAKRTAWLAVCGSLAAGMLLFMTASTITPLNSTFLHVILCLAGGAAFGFGLGFCSKTVLDKTNLI